ncbi:MAG: hypothetical protein GEU78_00005, partial [Actinobacteria bacterium]|nr:hypothetical protein [Actinomycetota bacterium]
MPSTMGANKSAVKADLDRVADETDAHGLAPVAVADPVGGPGEADRTVPVDDTKDLRSFGRLRGSPRVPRTPIHLVVVIDQM